jgi:GntR family transcriptional regulator/MocR family aminotransferase
MVAYLAQTRGIQADLPIVLITHVSQMSIFIAASLLLSRGSYVIVGDFIAQATYLRKIMELKGDHLMEDSLAALIDNGDVARHLKKVNKIFAQRRDYLCATLKAQLDGVASFAKPEGGLALWVTFDKTCPLEKISRKAAKQGLFINSGQLFDNRSSTYNALRFDFASLNKLEIDAAIYIIKHVL